MPRRLHDNAENSDQCRQARQEDHKDKILYDQERGMEKIFVIAN